MCQSSQHNGGGVGESKQSGENHLYQPVEQKTRLMFHVFSFGVFTNLWRNHFTKCTEITQSSVHVWNAATEKGVSLLYLRVQSEQQNV